MNKETFVFLFLVVSVIVFANYSMTSLAYARPGEARSPDIEQVIFIHFAKGSAKPPTTEKGYYKLIGAKWQTFPVKLEVNPSGSGLDEDFVRKAIGMAAEEWDSGAYSRSEDIAWYGVAPDLFADTIIITNKSYDDLAWTSDKLDGCNTIVWGNYSTPGVIAITILWYNRATKAIIEFDIVLDTDYEWGDAALNPEVMDLQNIATHELGHGIGLGDVYQPAAYQETMYGYSYKGEICKRDLYIGDKTGVTKLYGAASS